VTLASPVLAAKELLARRPERKKHDLGTVAALLQFPHNLNPIYIGHGDIQNDQVGSSAMTVSSADRPSPAVPTISNEPRNSFANSISIGLKSSTSTTRLPFGVSMEATTACLSQQNTKY
jgi:hypothetical protein